jgi:hypothetical protein
MVTRAAISMTPLTIFGLFAVTLFLSEVPNIAKLY